MKKNKKMTIVWIAAVLILAAAVFTFSYVLPRTLGDGSERSGGEERINVYDYFYEPVWSRLSERKDYEEYLDLDRYLYVKDGNVTRGMTEDNESSFGDEVLIFKKYFTALEAGDAAMYDSLFTKAYRETNGETPRFTAQMIYDRTLERVSSSHVGAVSSYTFNLYYKFYKNDGTFRRDVYSDAVRPLQIVVDNSDGEYRISSVKYFVS